MQTIQLSAQQHTSADFLFQQCTNSECVIELLATDKIGLAQQTQASNAEWQLVVFSQGLNIEKLWQVQQGLKDYIDMQYFVVGMSPADQQSAKARAPVQVKSELGLADKIEALAMALQVEISVVRQMPILSQPGLLLMDMDSTVIAVECIDEIAKLAGVGEQVSEVTELAMQGKLDFAESLRNRVACLKGADEAILRQVRDALPLMPGLENLVKTLQQQNWKVAIASGGFTYFADYLKDRLGLDAAVANRLAIENGKLLGAVDGDIVDAQVKAHTLTSLAEQWQIPLSQTIAMGDGANDLVMMQAAQLGVAFHAKPIVRTQADAAIRFGSLDGLLNLLRAEW